MGTGEIGSEQLIGNREILKLRKIAFLCSRKVPPHVVLKSYDWAIAQRKAGTCIISGFHSQIEKDALHYLLKGDQPIILALARGLKKHWEPEIQEALNKNRLLVVTAFDKSITRVTQETANIRNAFMADLADEIFVAYAQPGGNVAKIVSEQLKNGKRVETFDLPENEWMKCQGVICIQ